ncbi:MAG: heavy-metal-associated domain-containing protein [Tannerella sp.]|jgi:Cu(I)/Ag(I) efflux system membrane fusion protein|nr:heavy-metal-associated domain-containing protein [Tannerella sp.]
MKKLVLSVVVAFLAGTGSVYSRPTVSGEQSNAVSVAKASDTHAHLKVSGSCGMCKTRIEKAAKDVKGVSSVSWDREYQELHVNFDPEKTSIEAISKAIAKAGHDTDKDSAPDKVYKKLPCCCKYRK